eukprot:scaffold4058_cov257-Pinguiococcus_pyrenoidosus.AAC.6
MAALLCDQNHGAARDPSARPKVPSGIVGRQFHVHASGNAEASQVAAPRPSLHVPGGADSKEMKCSIRSISRSMT